MEWSINQRNTIDLIEGDLLVSASAGSGKTAVLVERIVNLILNYGVNIDEILIITFTNAAAYEMSERILNAIESKMNDLNRELLEHQMFLIQNANIQTFHAFCLEILKNNYYKLNLSGNLKILKDSQRKILINEVIEEVFLNYYEKKDEEFISLVNKYGGKYSDEKLREIIILIYNFMQTRPDINKFRDDILNTYFLEENEEMLNTSWGNSLKNECIFSVLKFKNYINEFINSIENEGKGYELLLNDLSLIEEFILKINKGYKECRGFLSDIKFLRFPSKLSEEFNDYKENRDKIKKIFEKFKKDIFFKTEEEMRNIIKDLHSTINKLIEVVYEFKNTFENKKLNQNLIDFNDMEHLTLKLLEDDSTAEGFRSKFKYILIDEYQDTNYIQEYLINKIKRKDKPNVFMVGDIKQSIYSFRGTKVDLFYEKYKSYNKVDSLDVKNFNQNKITLYDNYRSRKEIIDFINFIFKNIMVEEISDIEYTQEEFLNYKGSYETHKDDKESFFGEVKLGVIIKESGEDEEIDGIVDEIDEGECNLIVKYIKELVNSENILHKVFDKDLKEYRGIEYRDIVILMRNIKSSLKSSTLEEILIKNNIPVYFDGGDTFFDSIEVIIVISLLKTIDNPLDDIDLLSVLRSDIFNFSENQLAYLRIIKNDEFLYNNIKNVCEFELSEGEEVYLNEKFSLSYSEFKELYNKCKTFLFKINEYREKSVFMKIDEYIWYLYTDTNYYFNVSIKENGVRAQNNLRLIFNKAKEFRKSNSSGLFNFIEYLKNSKKSGDDTLVPKNISKNENVVRIMSIHKSKGLEFPVVILCNTSSSFNMKNSNSSLVLSDDFGLGINHVDYENNLETESLIKTSIKNKLKRNIFSEELRILYVALTRAKEKLFITGTYKNDKVFKRISDLGKCKSYLDFICNTLMKHKEGEYFRDKSEKQLYDNLKNECDVLVEIFNSNDLIFEEDQLDLLNTKDKLEDRLLNGEFKYLKDIDEILNFNYKFKEVVNTPISVSVSEILSYKDEEEKLNINFKKPSFLDENNRKIYTGMDIGNLYHLFMQNMKLKDGIDDSYIICEIERMLKEEILEEDDLKYLDTHKISKFFETDLGKRVIFALGNDKKSVYREFEFLMKHNIDKIYENEKVRIQGIIDLFFFEGDNIILIDYKTDKMILKTGGQVPNKYKEQLEYYKLALEKIFKKRVSEKYIYSFEKMQAFKI